MFADDITRPLPEPIKPRTLKVYRTGTGEKGYITSDGWLKITPLYGGRQMLGWHAEALRAPALPQGPSYRPLGEWRDMYCAPGGKVPWLVCDMDDGVLRVEPTRKAAAEWRAYFDDGLFIMRADRAHCQGYDPAQQPLYPFTDDPFEHVARPGDEKETVQR